MVVFRIEFYLVFAHRHFFRKNGQKIINLRFASARNLFLRRAFAIVRLVDREYRHIEFPIGPNGISRLLIDRIAHSP